LPMSPPCPCACSAVILRIHRSAEDGRGAAHLAAGFELAAEIVPAMVPMYRGHHLAVASGARGAVGDERAETCRLPCQLRLARLFEEDADANRMGYGRAAERHSVICDQDGESLAERSRQRSALFLGRDQSYRIGVTRHIDEIIGVKSKRLQRVKRCRKYAGVERVRMRDDVHVRPQPQDFRMDRPLGVAASRSGQLASVPVDQNEVVGAQDFAESDPVAFEPETPPLPVAQLTMAE